MSGFDPKEHLIKLSRRQKTADGGWKTIEFDYLPVSARVLWFRTMHPNGCIDAQQVQIDSEHCIARSEVRDGEGRLLAADFGMCTAEMWKRYPEKASTTATGRALAAAGFGTEFAGDELDEGVEEGGVGAAVDSPRPDKPRGSRIEQPKAMTQAAAMAAMNGKPQLDPNGPDAQRRFMGIAISRGYHDEERKIDLDRVHDLFGVERKEGAMKAWKLKNGLNWEQMCDRLIALDDGVRDGQQSSLDGMPAVKRTAAHDAVGSH